MFSWLFGDKKEEKNQVKPGNHTEEQNKWMYDFVLQFLNSPLWRVSILDFVDENCIIFDSEDENKFQYTEVHKNFKKLVSCLFDSMMTEIGLQEQELMNIIEKGLQSPADKKNFGQLLLCDDFLRFKHMMAKRNKALEEEVLKALKGQSSLAKKAHLNQKQLLRQSQKNEEERQRKLQEKEEEELRMALQMSLKEAEEQQKKQHKPQKQVVSPVKVQEKESEQPEQRKKRLLEQREKIRKRKQEERKAMLNQNQPSTMNVLLQEDGIHQTNVGEKTEIKVSQQEIQKRKELMKKIRNRIGDDS